MRSITTQSTHWTSRGDRSRHSRRDAAAGLGLQRARPQPPVRSFLNPAAILRTTEHEQQEYRYRVFQELVGLIRDLRRGREK
jgi:hypothetical protein